MTLINSRLWLIITHIKRLRSLFSLNCFRVALLFLHDFIFDLWSFTTLLTQRSSVWNLRERRLLCFHSGSLGTFLSSLIVWIGIRIWITDNLQRFLRILLKLIFFLTLVLLTHVLQGLHIFNIFIFVSTFQSCLFYSNSSCFVCLSITRTFWCIFKIRLNVIDHSRTFKSLSSRCRILLNCSKTRNVGLTIRLNIYRSWSDILLTKTSRIKIRYNLIHINTIMTDA